MCCSSTRPKGSSAAAAPLPFDLIIARAYGPTANIYKDIFHVSPDASQEELNEAYNRVWEEEQQKLNKLANDVAKNPSLAALKKKMTLQIDATFAAYQLVINTKRRKQYDKAIGLVLVEERAATSSMAGENASEVMVGRKEYVKYLSKDNENGEGKNPAPFIANVSPIRRVQRPRNEEDLPPVDGMLQSLDRLSLDESFPNRSVDSPAGVSEFFEHQMANEVEAEANYTALRKHGRKMYRGSKGKRSTRQMEQREAIDAHGQDDESDEESFTHEEINAEACVNLYALHLNTCPCAQSFDHDDDNDEESVLYD